MQMRDVAFSERDDVHAGEREALEEAGGVLLVAAEAIERFGHDDVDLLLERLAHHRLEAGPHDCRARDRMVRGTRRRCANPGAAQTRGRCGTGQRSTRRAGSRTSTGRRWRLSFAALFDRTIRLRDGLVEDLTRGLSCQQADEREHRLVGLPIDMRPMTRVTARHCSFAFAFEPAASTVILFVHA